MFGNYNSTQQKREDEERERQEQQEKWRLEQQFNKRKKYVEDHSGIYVKLHLENDKTTRTYKFANEEDEFIFMYKLDSSRYYTSSDYEKLLSYEDIRLDKKIYKAELLKTDNQVQQSREYCAELTAKQQPILIKFTASDQTELIATVDDLKQDFSSLGAFMQKIGVRNFRNIINIPEDVFAVKVINGEEYLAQRDYITFRQGNQLYLIRESYGDVCIAQIDIDKILYYKSEGSLRYEQQVTGGGGAGVNYGGAIVGGLLFGDVGAMIGSRRNEEVKEIETKTITHDDRIVLLALKAKGKSYQIGFDINSEMVFDWLIPEKQYDYVISKRREMYENGQL